MVTFDRFEVDLIRRRLKKDGRVIRLQPKPFLLLARLLERPGEVVTRGELFVTLWSGETHVEFDAGLNTAIRKLRRALGDSAADARFIQTVPGIGYRFIAPVPGSEPVVASAAASRPINVYLNKVQRDGWRNWVRLAAVGILAVLLSPDASHRGADEAALIADACALARAKQPQLALRTIERGLSVYPWSAALRAHRGLHLHAVGRYNEEMSTLLDAVARDPRSAEAQFHLGLGYARRRDFTSSLSALERAVKLGPTDPRYRRWLDLITVDVRTRPADPGIQGAQNPGT